MGRCGWQCGLTGWSRKDVATLAGRRVVGGCGLLAVAITALSFLIQPQLWAGYSARPWGFVFRLREWWRWCSCGHGSRGERARRFGFVRIYCGDVGECGFRTVSICAGGAGRSTVWVDDFECCCGGLWVAGGGVVVCAGDGVGDGIFCYYLLEVCGSEGTTVKENWLTDGNRWTHDSERSADCRYVWLEACAGF